jgi:NADPH:quinone reductase-like Zn-dependent oxidoreductase
METIFHAWAVRSYGGPEVLAPVTCDIPRPKAGQILVRIRASAVTRADGMMRSGTPKFARLFLGVSRPRAGLSGTCFAGDVVALGSGVTEFSIGDAIFGEAGLQFGANASHICLEADGSIVKKPATLRYEEAAVMFDGALTSWHFLTRVAKVKRGDKVLILGGSGSLGSAAVQFGKALGAEVSSTSSARNFELLRSLGADHVIDYQTQDPLSGDVSYDVIFDTLGVMRFASAKHALVEGGQYVCPVLGMELLRDVFLSRLFGTKRARFAAAGMEKPRTHRAEISEILQLVADSLFTPVMDRTYPFSDLVEAHRYVETGRKTGNVVVV